MERKAFERRMVGGLLILLILEVSVLVLHLTWGGFLPRHSTRQQQVAGQVSRTSNELHRRGVNSLVWEKSGANETLYFYDSVLTLAQSTASLKLYHDTEVQLAENTLVTIEPPDQQQYGEIRLKFHKGGFKARNPFAATQVHSDSWTMDIKTGSDVDVRQVGENQFELNVSKGEVDFQSNKGTERVSSDQILRIEADKPVKLQKLALKWVDHPPRRTYIHTREAALTLKWQGGGAKQLAIQKVGRPEKIQDLDGRSNDVLVNLDEGQYKIYLRDGEQTSDSLELEIWPAPLVHLLSPLPRNRMQTGTIANFIWSQPAGVRSFSLRVKGDKTNWQRELVENSYSGRFDGEDDLDWNVWGIDSEGFAIPPLYSYPLFIREDPLAAPKLKGPTLRQPAQENNGAGFWQHIRRLILPEVHADDLTFEAYFSWDPVERADHYVIEISETSDFRTPLVTEKVIKNEFLWKKAKLRQIYWRVAAGTARRLGYFSEPQLADLNNAQNSGVEVRRKPAPRVQTKPQPSYQTAQAPPPEPPAQLTTVEETPPPEIGEGFYVEWRPTYQNVDLHGSENVQAKLSGFVPLALAARFIYNINDSKAVHIHASYLHTNYKPDPELLYPFQEEVTWTDGTVHGVWYKKDRYLGWGLLLKRSTTLDRAGLEELKAKDLLWGGGSVNRLWHWRRLRYEASLQFLTGQQSGVATSHRFHLSSGRWLFGIGAYGELRSKSSQQTQSFTADTSIGFEF